MKKLLTSGHKLVLPLLLLATWAGSQAQSLGTPSSMAWIGRPLEMTVPARFASTDARDECVHADVSFGDTRLPPHRVRATIVGADPQQKRVRIETDAVIDEPVVTVTVRAGCRGAITRSYTLLPELASEQVVASLAAQRAGAAPPAAPLSPAMAAAAGMAPLQLAAATSTAAQASPRSRAPRPVAAAPREAAPARTRAARTAVPRQAVASARSGPRLRLEPIEADGSTLLRVSAQLAEPAGDAGRRATAALLWQAINADPQEVLRTTVMLQDLERDLAQLRQDTVQTRAEMATLRQRLDAAQPWYGSAAALQLLALLLLVAAAAAGVFWYRTRHSMVEHWYVQAPQPQPELQPAVAAAAAASPDAPPVPAEHPPQTPAAAAPAVPAAPVQRRGTDAVLRVETLAATFEEAEFLCSLGLAADAAAVLKSYLQDSASPAPIAFFELLRLCESEDDNRAAAAVRDRYAQLFSAEPPRLEQVTAPLGLESLAGLSASITSAWHTPRVLKVIEDALFGVPAAGPPLTLQAGRELLCLHDVATSLATEADTPGAGDGHALAPWANAEDAAGARLAVQSLADVGDGSVFGVDIDLGAPAAPVAPAIREPETSPLIAEMQAAAREAEERAARKRRQEEEVEAFSAAVASERMPLARH